MNADRPGGILPAQDIRALAARGGIVADDAFDDDQVQPASLDLRLGPVAYRVRASFLPGPETTVAERIDALRLHTIDLTRGALLEPGRSGGVYIVPLQESLDLPGDVAPAPGTGDRAVTLRTPTEDEPLRLLVAGDFTAQVLGDSLARASDATGVVDATVHYESASGLTRPDYFDWPAALEEDVEDHDPEVLVLVVGVNDAQGIVTADGAPAQLDDPRWGEEYHRRVGELMDQLRADDRMLVWVGQPPMRDGDFAARMSTINQVYAEQAGVRPWVTYVDPAALVGGPDGAYTDVATGPDGAAVELRQPDGIHLTAAGGDLIAGHVLGLVGDQVDLGERSGDAQDSARAADDPAG